MASLAPRYTFTGSRKSPKHASTARKAKRRNVDLSQVLNSLEQSSRTEVSCRLLKVANLYAKTTVARIAGLVSDTFCPQTYVFSRTNGEER